MEMKIGDAERTVVDGFGGEESKCRVESSCFSGAWHKKCQAHNFLIGAAGLCVVSLSFATGLEWKMVVPVDEMPPIRLLLTSLLTS